LLTKCLREQTSGAAGAKNDALKKRDEIAPEKTPLEKMLQNAGPLRTDGSDRFYGFENVSADPRPWPGVSRTGLSLTHIQFGNTW
jgi:hypothetical protein